MKPLFEHHYLSLLQDLAQLKCTGLPYPKELEGGFRIAYTYWRKVRTAVLAQGFPTLHEEIHFFKHIKPLFTSKIAYYTLLYHGQLFQPDYCPLALQKFWLREKSRLAQFLEDNRDFVVYYKSGATHHDEHYFRQSRSGAVKHGATPHGPNCEVASPRDHLVADLLSLERYHAYVQTLLLRLGRPAGGRATPANVSPGREH